LIARAEFKRLPKGSWGGKLFEKHGSKKDCSKGFVKKTTGQIPGCEEGTRRDFVVCKVKKGLFSEKGLGGKIGMA